MLRRMLTLSLAGALGFAGLASAISPPIRLTFNDDDDDGLSSNGAQIAWSARDLEMYATGGQLVVQIQPSLASYRDLNPHFVGTDILYERVDLAFPERDQLILWNTQAWTEVFSGDGDLGDRAAAGSKATWTFQACAEPGCGSVERGHVYLWDGASATQISQDSSVSNGPAMVTPEGHLMWRASLTGQPGSLFVWDGSTISLFTVTDSNGRDFDFDGTRVVWEDYDDVAGEYEVHYWDGAAAQEISTATGNVSNPMLTDGGAVWGQDSEIYLWDGSQTLQLTDNAELDFLQDAANGRVAYLRDDEVYVWEGGAETAVTSDGENKGMIVLTTGSVFWVQRADGEDEEIFVAHFMTPPVTECENGLDDDGDGDADYPADSRLPRLRR